jgi:carbamoyltransferase
MAVYCLGISCFYHDSAAALARDGEVVAAAQEERFTRKKHDSSFPRHAVAYCLRQAGLSIDQVQYVAFYEKPLVKFERILDTYLAYAPRGLQSFLIAIPLWLRERLWMSPLIRTSLGDYRGDLVFTEHHESHAAAAFFPSPFREAAILTIDGVGEWTTTSFGVGRDNRIELAAEMRFPHSLGLLYAAFTYYTGFKINSGEYKLMGLAPYGEPVYANLIYDHLIDLKEDGSFKLNMDYFDYCAGLRMTNDRFHRLFGGAPRTPESPLTQRDANLAASIQAVTDEVMLRMARHVRRTTGQRNLCMAGGVALNCVANGKILRAGIFDDMWIQPAAGDAGGALGAALLTWHQYLGHERRSGPGDLMQGAYLGPEFADEEIQRILDGISARYRQLPQDAIVELSAELLTQEKVVAWFQGRMEFGPRALGARSILGDPRSPAMQRTMNLKIKFRESFRPFAPSVLREKAGEWFELDRESPYMLLVADVKRERCAGAEAQERGLWGSGKSMAVQSEIPAVTHVDYSARIQTVDSVVNPLYYRLIDEFARRTGCPVIVNTSFNIRGEPIVCTPVEAYRCFMRTDTDFLVMGRFVLDKREQPTWEESRDWRKEFEPD